MRRAVICSLLAVCLAATASAQRPGEPEDAHERLIRRIERRLDAQSRVMTEIRDLLAESLRNNANDRVERVRQETLGAIATLRADLVQERAQAAEVQRRLDDTKRELEDVKNRNEVLKVESDRLRSEVAVRAQQQQILQRQVDALAKAVRDLKAAQAKPAEPKKPDEAKKKDGK